MKLSRRDAIRLGSVGLGGISTLRPTGVEAEPFVIAITIAEYIWEHIDKFQEAASILGSTVSMFLGIKAALAAPLNETQGKIVGKISSELESQPNFLNNAAAIQAVIRAELERADILKLIAQIRAISEYVKDFIISSDYTTERLLSVEAELRTLTPILYELGNYESFFIFPAYTEAATLHVLLVRESVSGGKDTAASFFNTVKHHRGVVAKWLSTDVLTNPIGIMNTLAPQIAEITRDLEKHVSYPILRNVIRMTLEVSDPTNKPTGKKVINKTRVADTIVDYKGFDTSNNIVLNSRASIVKIFGPGEVVPYEYDFTNQIGVYINVTPPDLVAKIPALGGDSSDYRSEHREVTVESPISLPDAVQDISATKRGAIMSYYQGQFEKRAQLIATYDGYKKVHDSIISANKGFSTLSS